MDILASLDALPPWQAAAAVLVVSLGAAFVAEFVVIRTARRLVTRTETGLDEIALAELRLPLVASLALAGVFVLTRIEGVVAAVPVSAAALEAFFGDPALTIVVLLWAWGLNETVNRGVDYLQEQGARYDFAPVLSNVWTLVVAVGTVGTVLYVWEIDVTPLLAGAGIAGIAVGFAAKDTVANFFGGVALYFDDTYRVGDFVELDSGETGTVVKVGVRSTTLLTRDEVLVTVPNSVLNATKVINQSAPSRRRRVRVPVGVAYGTDLDALEGLLVDIAVAEKLVLDSPKPRCRLRRFGDSALEYELLCWVSSPTRRAKAVHRLNRAIHDEFAEAGIEIPYPKRDVSVTGPASAAATPAPPTAAGGDDRVGDGAAGAVDSPAGGTVDPASDGESDR
ncbi:mechanosensitive ion channel family protein [Halobaculum magnesiiphilum]|uniref:Mechanosensitive ion channel family protein n=1 Tax=Halobaculum magnesiiphilum TaxID=1017351 RepID=A0A8T8WFS4_9EURY|nr:mechanosensitive ion channel family protein [Halobaculum magnesiiphilum]QZP38690.1 mechanosensitive ion channel family protein [Halobaculum magnesiiphilum]